MVFRNKGCLSQTSRGGGKGAWHLPSGDPDSTMGRNGIEGKLTGNPFFHHQTVSKTCCLSLKVSFWGMTANIYFTLSQLLEELKFSILKKKKKSNTNRTLDLTLQPLYPLARKTSIQGDQVSLYTQLVLRESTFSCNIHMTVG